VKAQSAWHKWQLPTGEVIKSADIINTTIYMIVERSDGTYLDKLTFAPQQKEDDLDFEVYLDRKVSLTGVYNSGTNTTTWTLPYADASDFTVVRNGAWALNKGLAIKGLTRPTSSTIAAIGNYSEAACYVGRNYSKSFELSKIYIRSASDTGGQLAKTTGRLQLRRILFSYDRTAYFEVAVIPEAREEYSRTFNAVIGLPSTTLGRIELANGSLSVPVNSRADTARIIIRSDSYLPFALLSAEWEGFYHNRAR
jgi:hypothetical protein